ncbi:MAG: methyltransferase domain-containing protein [Planctomycetes bacterium]|nr:methyltransferase domain-containing protein [Planctomycetota bacterium]
MESHAAAPRGREPEDECPGEVLERERWTRTRVGLGEPRVRFDWEAAFGRSARRVVDLGCGNGLFLIQSGYARPDTDHLGVELVPPAVRMGSLRAGQRGLSNVKFAWGDASEFICERVEPASLDEVHLYHPQPYYDRAKIPRRQLGPRTLLAIWLALREGGLFVFQTDNPEYARYAHENAGQLFEWRPRKAVWEDAPDGRTQRERVARAQGLEIFRVEARRLPLEPREAERRVAGMMEPDFDANKKGFDGRSPRGEGGGRRGARRRT